jgi:hypothetical protein
MLDGVVMQVVGVLLVIALIANDMFPKPWLPNSTTAFSLLRCSRDKFDATALEPGAGEVLLDSAPSSRIAIVAS